MHTPGFLGVEGMGQAPRWRLTELGYMGSAPTRDFLQWAGEPFVDRKKPRAAKTARSVRGRQHGSVQENRPLNGNGVLEKLHKELVGEGA